MEDTVPDAEKDEEFGVLRGPEAMQEWEKQFVPVSRVKLDKTVGDTLAAQKKLSASPLLKAAAKTAHYIWAMDAQCDIWIAYEELAPITDAIAPGIPRRRGEHIEKLGHPTLVFGQHARIAGEFFLDETESKELVWTLNVQSGRYCRSTVPSDRNKKAALGIFQALVEVNIILDDEL